MPKPRGNKNLSVKPVLHIYCEGKKTEPNYLSGYLKTRYPGMRLLQIIKVEKTNKNTPLQLVDTAITTKNDPATPKHDKFWVVYDRESKHKYSNTLHSQTFDKARSQNISVAISNVCFELWILLHFCEVTAPFTCYKNLMSESDLKKKLKSVGINKYEKAGTEVFEKIKGSISDARKRAIRMNTCTIESSNEDKILPYLLNPYTDVYKLLDSIDDFVSTNLS